MYGQAERGLLRGMNPRVTLVTIAVVAVAMIYGAFYTERLASGLTAVHLVPDPFLEWYYVLLFGPTQYLIAITIESAGDYIQNLMVMTFHTNATRDGGWQAEWTVFFWGWWLAWSPFVGVFIARVSRGRTFREFFMGVLLVPTVITVVWIGLFGAGGIIVAVDRDVATALFATIDAMGLGAAGRAVSLAMVVLIATYLITSANAGTLVINTILSGGDPEPPTLHRILWGVVLGVLTAVLLMVGGLETLQVAVITAALLFLVVIMLMIAGLLKALHREHYAARTGERTEAPYEPWVDLEDAGTEPVPLSGDEAHKLY